ncbi:MAG: MFS transporter [Halioglobus sp.]|nr:MFS transporter [Halioglobus sp.]
MSQSELILLTLVSAAVTANAYYIHPIIARVGQDFAVSASAVGLVPALNQIALALGIFLLLPLGDRFSNRRLVVIFVFGQFCALLLMAFAHNFWLFTASSALLGFATIAPYLLPAYVSKRVEAEQLGHVTATLTTGVILGILLARAGAGVVGEYLGWRMVYYIASGLMLIMVLVLPCIMREEEEDSSADDAFDYGMLLASMGPLIKGYPETLLSGFIQALNFGLFISVWLGLGLHLTSPAMGYGVDVVGYLALLTVVNLFTTPRLGRFADKVGARRARLLFACVQLFGASLLSCFGYHVLLLLMPLLIMNIVGPIIDVSGRMLFLSERPEIRTRLSTLYIVEMFVGGGLASFLGTAAYQWGGWQANALLALGISFAIVSLSYFSLRFEPRSVD